MLSRTEIVGLEDGAKPLREPRVALTQLSQLRGSRPRVREQEADEEVRQGSTCTVDWRRE